MTEDFYCDEVLSGKTEVKKVLETENVLAFYHTKPFWQVHIVVIPKRHINSLIALENDDNDILLEMMDVIKKVSEKVLNEKGCCRVLTNLGNYQDSKHIHWHVISGEQIR